MEYEEKITKNLSMLEGGIGGKLMRFALPLAATGILQQLFNAADIAVVGRFVGKEAMGAVGANTPVINLIISLFLGVSIGANVVIARYTGQRDDKSVRQATHTALLFALISGTALAILCQFGARDILALMSIPDNVFDMALLYFRVYVAGMPVILLYNFASAVFRGRGNTRTPLICLMLSGVVNVLLNLLFVIGLGRTVEGVALATVLSNLISSALLIVFLIRERSAIHLDLRALRIHKKLLAETVRIGLPAGVQSMVFAISNMVIQSAVNRLGDAVMAGSAAAFNIEIFVYYIMNAFGQACTTFVGQNYGAGNPERCLRATRIALLQDIVFTVVIAGVILLFGRQSLMIFNDDPAVVETGVVRLRYILTAELLNVVIEIVSGCMRGYGRSLVPALLCTIGIVGVRLGWVFTVFRQEPTFDNLMMTYPVSWVVTALALAVSYYWTKHHGLREFFAGAVSVRE